MKRSIVEFVAKCLVCQQVKVEHQRLAGLLKHLEIPVWKWEHITMDFLDGLSKNWVGKNIIWVILDRLMKTAYFLPIEITASMAESFKLYMDG